MTCSLKSFFKNIVNESSGDFLIYCYVTSDQTRFIFIYDTQSNDIKEDTIKSFFSNLHYEFAKIMLNPLQKLNSFIENRNFDSEVDKLLSEILK